MRQLGLNIIRVSAIVFVFVEGLGAAPLRARRQPHSAQPSSHHEAGTADAPNSEGYGSGLGGTIRKFSLFISDTGQPPFYRPND
jgi:hypothetical protein